MKSQIPSAPAQSDDVEAPGCYATAAEVQAAMAGLTDSDHAKLALIAAAFCKSRKFVSSVMEPAELISEAVLRTLMLKKKWNKSIPFLKHMDRAMENISGHVAHERSRIVQFPEGDEEKLGEGKSVSGLAAVDEAEEARTVNRLLREIFGDDMEAADVFVRKVEGFSPMDIQKAMKIAKDRYDTITRRIHRKIVSFINTKNPTV